MQIDELADVLVAHRRTERDAIAAIGDSPDFDGAETAPDQDEPETGARNGSSLTCDAHRRSAGSGRRNAPLTRVRFCVESAVRPSSERFEGGVARDL
ncbi:hypothetical protein [Nocardia salmonicida]|uniref:hypothetical protein n=1 Tax=Nocardia salmonicida TaxID=53431 RepID=UPI00340BEE35